MDYFASALETVLRDADIEEAVLVGHSMGTQVARQFYRRYPEQTRAIVVVDGTLVSESREKMLGYVQPFRTDYRPSMLSTLETVLRPARDSSLRQWIRAAMLRTPTMSA